MGERRKKKHNRRRAGRSKQAAAAAAASATQGIEVNGWTILAHPLFLEQIEKLTAAAETERQADPTSPPGPNAKLLAHLLDLAFEKIPRDPGNAAYRHGGTLGESRRHWFRGKTGNGRYRLFYRFQSAARIIVYAWVNDENSLRTYGSNTDAYAVFAAMLDDGNPPDDWEDLVNRAKRDDTFKRLKGVAARRNRGR